MRLFHVVMVSVPLTIGVAGAIATSSLSGGIGEPPVPQVPTVDTIDLVVGDTLQYARRLRVSPDVVRLVSSNPDVGGVTPAGGVVARVPGVVTITPADPLPRIFIRIKTPRQATNEFIPEVCANVDSEYFADSLPVSTSLALIHEYHDCQRLINPSGEYSAVIGIFAPRHVQEFNTPVDYLGGRLAALIVNFVGNKNLTYAPLGLAPGVNCLIVRWSRATPRGARGSSMVWEAAIIPQATPARNALGRVHYGDCPDSLNWNDVPSIQKGKLRVVTQTGFDMRGRALAPPVARWDWDARGRQNYMGVKCGLANWCEIGPAAGFVTSVARRNSANQPLFKGFYDEQFLSDSAGGPIPSSVFGTITPGAHNEDIGQMAGRAPTARYHASRIQLLETAQATSPTYGFYARMFYTTQTSASPRSSRSDLTLKPRSGALLSGYLGEWNNRPLPGDAIHFTTHTQAELVVPTVRWRWQSRDERTWSYCYPDGCCEDMFKRY